MQMQPPRPILKTSHDPSRDYFPSPLSALPFRYLHSPHVHFPPSPILTDTRTTHSSAVYDRAPIAVSPNTCELPERGARVYAPLRPTAKAVHPNKVIMSSASPGPFDRPPSRANYFHHSRALERGRDRDASVERRPATPVELFLGPFIYDRSTTSSPSGSGLDTDTESDGYTEVVPHPFRNARGPRPGLIRSPASSSSPSRRTDEDEIDCSSHEQRSTLRKKKKTRDRLQESCSQIEESDLSLDGCLGGF